MHMQILYIHPVFSGRVHPHAGQGHVGAGTRATARPGAAAGLWRPLAEAREVGGRGQDL